ncbi:unnamed protein product [Clonostachys byssicola]|uniref:Zn(2)-C6 fungal-type domain-containing protein n=1 Tax=Clonostachys byssicola TaxID=160290 RepID=A0A9N9ULK5_9HYPO|nr:unnamed protein product [Clonostachys byssicola]
MTIYLESSSTFIHLNHIPRPHPTRRFVRDPALKGLPSSAMSSGSGFRDKRSQQACVPCRRKKSKCPAEKPVCSACQRLNLRCEYRAKDPVTKPQASTAQVPAGVK